MQGVCQIDMLVVTFLSETGKNVFIELALQHLQL